MITPQQNNRNNLMLIESSNLQLEEPSREVTVLSSLTRPLNILSSGEGNVGPQPILIDSHLSSSLTPKHMIGGMNSQRENKDI